MLFREFAEMWLLSKRGTVKDNTYEISYKIVVRKHIIPYFSEKNLAEITPFDVQAFLRTKCGEVSKSLVKKAKQRVKGIFDMAVAMKFCEINPAVQLKYFKGIEQKTLNVYTAEQVGLITDYALQHRFGLDVIILLETGIRRGDANVKHKLKKFQEIHGNSWRKESAVPIAC
jgi:integrase